MMPVEIVHWINIASSRFSYREECLWLNVNFHIDWSDVVGGGVARWFMVWWWDMHWMIEEGSSDSAKSCELYYSGIWGRKDLVLMIWQCSGYSIIIIIEWIGKNYLAGGSCSHKDDDSQPQRGDLAKDMQRKCTWGPTTNIKYWWGVLALWLPPRTLISMDHGDEWNWKTDDDDWLMNSK